MGSSCARDQRTPPKVIEFDGDNASVRLHSGWSGFEKAPDGATFCWAEGHEASLSFGPAPRMGHEIAFRAWSFDYAAAAAQRLTVFVNDSRVGELVIPPAPSELSISTPWSVWANGENVLRFRFSRADAPADRMGGTTDGRKLAVAFDWIRIEPRPL